MVSPSLDCFRATSMRSAMLKMRLKRGGRPKKLLEKFLKVLNVRI